MKTGICYFSGTGNTDFIARKLRHHLENNDIPADLCRIEEMTKEKAREWDTVILGAPVYALRLPDFFMEKILNLPFKADAVFHLFATKGFFAFGALDDALLRLRNKGYRICSKSLFNMPGSDGLNLLAKDSRFLKYMLNKDRSHIKKFHKLIQLVKNSFHQPRSARINRFRLGVSNWAHATFAPRMHDRVRQSLMADDNCVLCGRCVDICPLQNISIENNAVVFHDHCAVCLRCLNQCPSEAIQMGNASAGKFRYKGPDGNYKG